MDFTHIEHQVAVDSLKAAGNSVNLVRFSVFFYKLKNEFILFLGCSSFSTTLSGRN